MQVSVAQQKSETTATATHSCKNVYVRDLFAGVPSGPERAAVMSDGEFDPENRSVKTFDNWPEFYSAIDKAVEECADHQIHDRRGLGGMIGRTMGILQGWNPTYKQHEYDFDYIKKLQPLFPTAWAAIRKKLMEGGAITFNPNRVVEASNPNEFPPSSRYACFQSACSTLDIDIEPLELPLRLAEDDGRDWGYCTGWRYIHDVVTKELDPLPSDVIAVRDFMYTSDATPDKPASPPWQAVAAF